MSEYGSTIIQGAAQRLGGEVVSYSMRHYVGIAVIIVCILIFIYKPDFAMSKLTRANYDAFSGIWYRRNGEIVTTIEFLPDFSMVRGEDAPVAMENARVFPWFDPTLKFDAEIEAGKLTEVVVRASNVQIIVDIDGSSEIYYRDRRRANANPN